MTNTERNNLGTKPVFSLLLTTAIPAIISMLIQSMYNIVDSIFVAKISENALTAVSLAFPVQYFVLSVAVGTGVGINSLISRKLGEKQPDEANSAVTHGFLITLATSLIFIFVGIFGTRPFFDLFSETQASAEITELGCQYTYIVTIFSSFSIIHIFIEKILQATGKMIFPMIFQGVGAVVNIILDPIFIFVFDLGVSGAAIATVIAQFTSMALALIVFITKDHDVRIKIKGFKFKFDTLKSIYAVGIPSILMMSLSSVMVLGINKILVTLSESAVSTYGFYYKLQSFVFMPVSGLSQGALPIMGYNYGAKNHKRLTDTLKFSLLLSSAIMLSGTLIFMFIPKQLLFMVNASENMLSIGIPALRIISLSFVASAFGQIFSTFFQAVGKGINSLVVSCLRQIIFILPVAFLLSKTAMEITGVWITFPIAEVLTAVIAFIMYKKTINKILLKDKV